MKKIITNNIGLKILAVLVAFVSWLVVVNYDDPIISNTYSGIQVEIINGDRLSKQGKVYEVLDNTDTISVTFYGTRSVVESINKENIRAVADMEELTLMDTIAIQLSTNKNFDKLESMKSDIKAVSLSIEDVKVINLPITVNTKGTPAEGYVIGDISTNQNTVRISGPESVVSRIDHVECEVDVSGRTTDITTNADLKLMQADGIQVEHKNLSQNIKTVNISVGILATKTVDVIYHISGTPAEGYVADTEVTADHMSVTLAGRQSVLDGIYVWDIPAAALNVEGRDESFTMVIDLKRYLPDGTRLVDAEFDGKTTANVTIRKTVSRTLNIPLENISLTNIPDEYTAEVLMNTENVADNEDPEKEVLIQVLTSGVSDAYDGVSGANTTGYVDIGAYMTSVDKDKLTPGIYQMEITFELPEGITVQETYYANVRIDEETE